MEADFAYFIPFFWSVRLGLVYSFGAWISLQDNSFADKNETPKNVFDLGAFVGDLTFEEDASGYVEVCAWLVWGLICNGYLV